MSFCTTAGLDKVDLLFFSLPSMVNEIRSIGGRSLPECDKYFKLIIMKAILIDVHNKDVREVEIPEENTLQAWYNVMHVDLVTVGHYINDHDSILVDDEGLLKPDQAFFYYEGAHQPFSGNGLVVGVDEEGNSVSCEITVKEVKKNTRFLNINEVIDLF